MKEMVTEQHSINIHEFTPSDAPHYDDEGEEMIGFYYQFIDTDDEPVSAMIGPYINKTEVEKAATRAFHSKDY